MRPTTIKLDAKLHAAIRRMKAREQTLTGFVRELVMREEKKAALEAAADVYAALLGTHPDEAGAMAAWEAAPLADAPKRRRK
jgi:hypothetical protein